MANRGLTNKQKMFVEAYLETLNATEAARRAQYKGNENTLGVVGYENLRKPKIKEEIDRRLQESIMSANEVLYRLTEQAKGAHSEYMTPSGPDMNAIVDEGKAHLIKKYKRDASSITVEFYDSQSALVHLAKYYALFTDRIKVEDWRSEIIELLRDGKITPKQVEEEIGGELASELFKSAGISISETRKTAD